MPQKILITGGTGLIGSKLRAHLIARGDEVVILTTSALKADEGGYYYWNPKDRYIDLKAFEGVDYIVHLAGTGVADKRWTNKRKKEIYESRVHTTRWILDKAKGRGIKGVLAASAIGYYGMDTGDAWVSESSSAGSGFLADVVTDWEKAIFDTEEAYEQTAALRIGIVLSTKGGALAKMITPFKFGLGSPIGSGKQYMSWIHLDDLVSMFLHVMDQRMSGIFNAVAPNPVTNADFSKNVARVLKKPYWLPNVPAFVLRIIFGELAGVILGGNRVHAGQIQKAGFKFAFPKIDQALEDLLK